MSLSHKQIDELSLLTSILEVIRDPDKLIKLIKDSNEAVDDYKQVVEKGRRIKDIDKWYREQCDSLVDTERKLDIRHTDLDKMVLAHQTMVKENLEKYDKKVVDVAKQRQDLEDKIKDLGNLKAMREKLNSEQKSLSNKSSEIAKQERELADKLEGVEKILGRKL